MSIGEADEAAKVTDADVGPNDSVLGPKNLALAGALRAAMDKVIKGWAELADGMLMEVERRSLSPNDEDDGVGSKRPVLLKKIGLALEILLCL